MAKRSSWAWVFEDYKPEWACVALGLSSPALLALMIFGGNLIDGLGRLPYSGNVLVSLYLALTSGWVITQALLIWKRGRRAYASLYVAPFVLLPAIFIGPLLVMCQFRGACL